MAQPCLVSIYRHTVRPHADARPTTSHASLRRYVDELYELEDELKMDHRVTDLRLLETATALTFQEWQRMQTRGCRPLQVLRANDRPGLARYLRFDDKKISVK